MDRTRLGALAWVSLPQYLVMLIVVASAWTTPYDPVRHTLSDLGAVGCTQLSNRYVCSPWHDAANISWMLTGIAITAGAVLTAHTRPRTTVARVGTWLLAAAGIGELLVGLHPEDASTWHLPAAGVAIICGVAGILLSGWALRTVPGMRAVGVSGIALGCVGVVFTVMIAVVPRDVIGLVERLAAGPILVWCVVTGIALLRRFPARQPDTPQDTPYR